ncbi:hypothetical protein CQA38_06185 [Campylobacter sp. MIT 12-5580]|uniref:ABC transporter substrate-binding protein n=1 Tax=Campylobacter sp. MIT 12-5580 TaxID=2040651 RepID=UPI0010F5168C|nr:ABC transporter substrate-binding protein [Campylobacter sp. MIT 12-5580]TKX28736.1 hypothetical protein CQA38_06185 [Campylobacter sp. MIT 12-5580]
MKFVLVALCFLMSLNLLQAKEVKRVAVADSMLPIPALFLFLSDAKLVYIPEASKTAFEYSVVADFFPELKNVKASLNDNFEELLLLNADLYVCHEDGVKLCDFLQKAGVKVLPLKIKVANFNSKEVLRYWLERINEYVDIKEKADKIIAKISQVEEENARLLKDVKPVRAMMMTIYQKQIVVGAFGDYLLSKSGGVDVFKGVWNPKDGGVINFEELYRLNPEVIYITNFSPTQPSDLINDKKWQGIKAIQDKRVYKLPLATYRPYAPNLDLPVLLQFLASKNHPELFKELDIRAEYKKHFKEFYNLELNDMQLERILYPDARAGDVK